VRPEGLLARPVDRTTGLLATSYCPAELVYTEHYIPNTEPREECDVHGPWGTLVRPGDENADSLGAPITDDFEF
jgi:hypothetical protein